MKLSANGSALLVFRYIGGNSADSIKSLALLTSGEVAVLGSTASHDLPDVTPDAAIRDFAGTFDGFLAVFSSGTLSTRYFSFLGGSVAATNLATTGMRGYLTGSVYYPEFGGIPIFCDDASADYCTSLVAAFDLTQ